MKYEKTVRKGKKDFKEITIKIEGSNEEILKHFASLNDELESRVERLLVFLEMGNFRNVDSQEITNFYEFLSVKKLLETQTTYTEN